MADIPRWRRYLRFWRPDVDADIDDELRFHFESRTADLRARGLSAEAARRQATEEFGDEAATRRSLHDIGARLELRRTRLLWWDAARADLRYALRGVIGSPMLTTVVVLTLAIGIGATATTYSVMRQLLLLPPPHVIAPERMVKLYFTRQNPGEAMMTGELTSFPVFEAARTQDSTVYESIAYIPGQELAIGTGADARLGQATMVSSGFWRTLGVRPSLGRFITDDEAHPATGARVAVLGYGLWQRRFGGARDVLGRVLHVRGVPYTIVGVAPRGFRGLEFRETDVWLPLRAYDDDGATPPRWHRSIAPQYVELAARLRPGVSAPAAEGRASELYSTLTSRWMEGGRASRPEMRPRWGVKLAGVTGALDASMTPVPEARLSQWLVGVAGILLGVACANVSGLLLLRALRRRREIAVRVALGMSRRRLALLLFVEGSLFAFLGGLAAVVIASLGGDWMRGVLIQGMATESWRTDWAVVLLATICMLGAAVAAGLAPLMQIRGDTLAGLREGGERGATRRSVLFQSLIVLQTALSVVLLVGAGLFVRSMQRIAGLDHGMDVRNVLTVQADFAGTMRSTEERTDFYRRALERARTLPGVVHASLALYTPLRGASVAVFRVAGSDEPVQPGGRAPLLNDVADEFFAATGMRIIQGRDFTAADLAGLRPVVVNQSLARHAWPGRSPLGECVYFTSSPDECSAVVGVVADARTFALREEQRPWFYRPLRRRDDTGSRVLLVRVAPDARGIEQRLRQELRALDPAQPFLDVRTLGDALDPQIRPFRLGASVFTVVSLLAALLAAVGLYAAVGYAVTQRTREIGIRVAVGATARQVLGMVIGDGCRTAMAGVVLGLVIGVAAGPLIAELLFDVSPRDPIVLGLVAGGALLTASLASVVPARRAAAIDPSTALRAE